MLLMISLIACPPCNPIIVDNGQIPEQALSTIPYQDGDTCVFKHSNGLEINFFVTRQTTTESSYWEHCEEYTYQYQINSAKLLPDYPVFEFNLAISNLDTTNLNFYASIGKFGFMVPVSEEQYMYAAIVDSVFIASDWYYDVFRLKSDYYNYNFSDSIYADSLYYNYEFGILKILMSNGEYYEISR